MKVLTPQPQPQPQITQSNPTKPFAPLAPSPGGSNLSVVDQNTESVKSHPRLTTEQVRAVVANVPTPRPNTYGQGNGGAGSSGITPTRQDEELMRLRSGPITRLKPTRPGEAIAQDIPEQAVDQSTGQRNRLRAKTF